jgi:hypothetical protein
MGESGATIKGPPGPTGGELMDRFRFGSMIEVVEHTVETAET